MEDGKEHPIHALLNDILYTLMKKNNLPRVHDFSEIEQFV